MDTKLQPKGAHEDLAEVIHDWAVEVGGSEKKGEEILGNEHQPSKSESVSEKVLEMPEGTVTLIDCACDEETHGCLQVIEFE